MPKFSAATVKLKLRHTDGDIDLGEQPATLTGAAARQLAISHWPTEGPLAAHAPANAACLRLILNGRTMEPSGSLEPTWQMLSGGDPGDVPVVTLHAVVREDGKAGKQGGKDDGSGDGSRSRSCCVVQ
ncbi:unnamed protein product [Pedinophyceae sp. YPF-701]|nr:unnamed protein product [Pedinophyceae sp. YPF-701]